MHSVFENEVCAASLALPRRGQGMQERLRLAFTTQHRDTARNMTPPLSKRKFLYVRRPAWLQDGGTIYDDMLVRSLRDLGAIVREIDGRRLGTVQAVARAILRASTPRYTRFVAEVPQLLDAETEIILSHESFSALAHALPVDRRIHLILHNLPSAFDDEGRLSVDGLMMGMSRLYERRLLSRSNVTVLVLSLREQRILDEAGFNVKYLPPGCPQARPLLPTNIGSPPELVVSGTFGWSFKRRDAAWLGRAILQPSKFSSVVRMFSDATFNGFISGRTDLEKLPQDHTLRVGIVPDRFVTGMKLKVLWYIANNCLVLSPRDLGEEFRDVPHADRFVRLFSNVRGFDESLSSLEDFDDWDAFAQFRSACLERFDWTVGALGAFGDEGLQ